MKNCMGKWQGDRGCFLCFFLIGENGSWKGTKGSKDKFCITMYCFISLVLSFNFCGEEKGGISFLSGVFASVLTTEIMPLFAERLRQKEEK